MSENWKKQAFYEKSFGLCCEKRFGRNFSFFFFILCTVNISEKATRFNLLIYYCDSSFLGVKQIELTTDIFYEILQAPALFAVFVY